MIKCKIYFIYEKIFYTFILYNGLTEEPKKAQNGTRNSIFNRRLIFSLSNLFLQHE